MKSISWLCFTILVFMVIGCNTLTLRPAEFAWPVEIVVKPDAKGNVQDTRYQIGFNVKALLFDAVQDSVNVTKHSLRVIRNQDGFYFSSRRRDHSSDDGRDSLSLFLESRSESL